MHRPENAVEADAHGDEHLYDKIRKMFTEPEKMPILSGDPRSPYIRIDPYFMDPVKDNPRAQKAFEALVKALDAERSPTSRWGPARSVSSTTASRCTAGAPSRRVTTGTTAGSSG